MLFEFVPPISGTYQGDEYWYVAEQITPVTQTVGTVFQAGQPVATFAGAGTCIEIGWGSPTSDACERSRRVTPTRQSRAAS